MIYSKLREAYACGKRGREPLPPPLAISVQVQGRRMDDKDKGSLAPSPLLLWGHVLQAYFVEVTTKEKGYLTVAATWCSGDNENKDK